MTSNPFREAFFFPYPLIFPQGFQLRSEKSFVQLPEQVRIVLQSFYARSSSKPFSQDLFI